MYVFLCTNANACHRGTCTQTQTKSRKRTCTLRKFLSLTGAHVDLRKTSIAPGIKTSSKQLSPHRHCWAGVSPTGTPTSFRKRGTEGLGEYGGGSGGGGGLRENAAKNMASKGGKPWAEGAYEGEGPCGDAEGSQVEPEDLVLLQELASASQTETRLNASSSAGSGAGKEKAFGWEIRPLTPSGEVDMSETMELSASRGPATPVLWV